MRKGLTVLQFKNSQFKLISDYLKPKKSYHGLISFLTGSVLAISESLPFVDNKYNGILHTLSIIQKEYFTDLK